MTPRPEQDRGTPITPEAKQRVWALLGAVASEDNEALVILLSEDLSRIELAELIESLARLCCHMLAEKAHSPEHLTERLQVWALRAALEGSV